MKIKKNTVHGRLLCTGLIPFVYLASVNLSICYTINKSTKLQLPSRRTGGCGYTLCLHSGQVSSDWWRAGHVTTTSPLIGQESPSSRPRQPSTATLSHASAEMTLSVYKVLAVTANNRWLQYRRSN